MRPIPDTPPDRTLLAWAGSEQAALVARVAAAAGARVVAAGGPDPGDAAAIERALDAAPGSVVACRDLRHALRTSDDTDADGDRPPVSAVLVAARGSLEAGERAALRTAGRPVISLEPRPARLADFAAELGEPGAGRVPRLGETGAWAAAGDAIREFGPIHLVDISCLGRPDEGSLHARLHDAMDALERLLSGPARVAAAADGPASAVPEHLAGLRGSLSVRVQGDRGWCAAIACSDAAPRWDRRVTIIGPAGRLDLDDEGFGWVSADGRTVERLGAPTARPVAAPTPSDATESGSPGARHIAALFDRPPAADGSPDHRIRRFALCEAARLAARTRESEDPARIASMLA